MGRPLRLLLSNHVITATVEQMLKCHGGFDATAFISQGDGAPAVSQPPGAGHTQRLSHVGQPGLDRPVAPRRRGSHGGAARGGSGL